MGAVLGRVGSKKDGKLPVTVYHNYEKTGKMKKLHNSENYVNKCNQNHKGLCRTDWINHIF